MGQVVVLDHGYVRLRNIAGPTRRKDEMFDADDTDPANAARFSFDAADDEGRERVDDLKLADYLFKHRHTTPFEMITVWLEMKMPIFVARQFVRHRTVSINEVSARYTKLPKQFYIPDPANVGSKSASNKQGRDIIAGEVDPKAEVFTERLSEHCAEGYAQYEEALVLGTPPELARCFLSLNIYTKWLWKQDLHNMMHFLGLRMDKGAQFEARQYANAIHSILTSELPHLMRLFDEQQAEQANAKANVAAMHEFCDRVEKGEVNSSYTYQKFKALLRR